jgi:hypothetical protein
MSERKKFQLVAKEEREINYKKETISLKAYKRKAEHKGRCKKKKKKKQSTQEKN